MTLVNWGDTSELGDTTELWDTSWDTSASCSGQLSAAPRPWAEVGGATPTPSFYPTAHV